MRFFVLVSIAIANILLCFGQTNIDQQKIYQKIIDNKEVKKLIIEASPKSFTKEGHLLFILSNEFAPELPIYFDEKPIEIAEKSEFFMRGVNIFIIFQNFQLMYSNATVSFRFNGISYKAIFYFKKKNDNWNIVKIHKG